jgi:hypothetical protein
MQRFSGRLAAPAQIVDVAKPAEPMPVNRVPARILGNPHPREKDDHAERRPGQEGEPPSELRIDQRGIEPRDRDQGAERRAHPEATIGHQVDMAAVARRDQLLEGRIDSLEKVNQRLVRLH